MNKYINKNLNLSSQFLIQEYIKNRKSAYQLSKELNCSSTLIYWYLKKCNIKRRTLSESQKGISKNKGKNNGMYGKHTTLYQKQSCLKGRNHPRFGKIAHGKWTKYKKTWMRSSWEVIFAKYCIRNHIKYRYETKTFDLGNCTYTPDFYLPELNKYIEIKGYWREDAKKKFKLFKKQYPKVNINIINKSWIDVIGGQNNGNHQALLQTLCK